FLHEREVIDESLALSEDRHSLQLLGSGVFVEEGFELYGEEEKNALLELWEKNGGILFAHGFDAVRKGVYRVREFEKEFAAYVGSAHAQAVTSGSTALLVGLQALGVKPGDEVITQCHTFVATAEAIILLGATPVFTEIDENLNMCPKDLEKKITGKTRAIIPVHMSGLVADMDPILEIARKNKVPVLEDNAQGMGAFYKGKSLGTLGDVGTFSFDFGKLLTTGEGGMVVTPHEKVYQEALAFHDHGHEYNPSVGRADDTRHAYGFNFRMTELQGALGLVQLKKVKNMIAIQRENKKKLKAYFSALPIKFRKVSDPESDCGDSLVFLMDSTGEAEKVVARMKELGVGTKNLPDALRWHFAGLWEHMLDGKYDIEKAAHEWPASRELLYRSIALPISLKMTDASIENMAQKVIQAIKGN
ncbi:DegT/DnrJ/EryC1/StrS family aminotransferase, partial [Candidatus Riflebacteria bacterium]